jgi:glycosyltransferase involved in cell wall biosynthesis
MVVRANAALASAVVVPTRTVADAVPGRTPTVVAHPSIDPSLAGGDRTVLRRAIGATEGTPVLATLGNLVHARGPDVAIRALALLRERHPDARLLLAGEPHPRRRDRAFAASLHPLARRLGVGDAVHLCGLQDPGDLLAAADVFVNPARFAETFGRAAMEALVAGKPVVSTSVGAVPEVLHDGRDALLVPKDDPGALAAAIERLLTDRALADALVEAGRTRVLTTFTEARQLECFEEAIELALRSRRPSSVGACGRAPAPPGT